MHTPQDYNRHDLNEPMATKTVWMETLLGRFASGTGIALLGRVLGRFLFVLGQVIFARNLGPEEFGLFAIGWTLLQMLGTIAPLGLDIAVIRYGTKYWKTNAANLKSVFIQSIGTAFISGSILSFLLFLSAPTIARGIFHNDKATQVLQGLAPAFTFFSIVKVIAAATRVTQKTRYAVVIEDLLPSSTSFLIFIPLFFLGYGLSAAINSIVLGYLLSLIIGILMMRKLFPEIFSHQRKSKPMLRNLISFSLPSWLAGAFSLFIIWINRLLVGVFRPESDVGIYQAISQISQLFPLVTSAISHIFSPMIADLFHRKKDNELQELYTISTKWGLYLSLPLLIFVLLTPGELLEVLFGNAYRTGAPALIILSLGQLINIGSGFVGWMMLMTGHQVRWFWVTAISICVSLGVNITLTPHLGLTGASIATAIGLSIFSIIGLFQIRYDLDFLPYDKRYFKIVLSSLISIGIVLMTRTWLPDNPLLRLILSAMVLTSSFMFWLFIFGFDPEDLLAIRLLKSWIPDPLRKNTHARR